MQNDNVDELKFEIVNFWCRIKELLPVWGVRLKPTI